MKEKELRAGRTTAEVSAQTVYTEKNEEFTLPEYAPAIGRVLRCRARVLPTGRFVGAEKAEFSGTVLYHLLYLGEDGVTAETMQSSDYEFSATVPDGQIEESTVCDNVLCRPTAARRVQWRTRLKSRVTVSAENDVPTVEAPENADLLQKTVRAHRICRASSGEFAITEQAEGVPQGTLYPEGTAVLTDVRAESGKVVCRGELTVRAVGCGETLAAWEQKYPFEETVAMSSVVPSQQVCATVRVWSCELEAGEDGAGNLSAVCEIAVVATEPVTVSAVEDAFLPDAETVIEKKPLSTLSVLAARNFSVSVSGTKPLESPAERVIAPTCEVTLGTPEIGDGKATFAGTLSVAAIGVSADGEPQPLRMEIPVRAVCDVDGTATPQGLCGIWQGTAANVRLRVEDGSVRCDAEVFLSVLLAEKATAETVTAVAAGEKKAPAEGFSIRIVYPEAGDTLWQIAKRCGVSVARIAEVNRLAADVPVDAPSSLSGIAALLIG